MTDGTLEAPTAESTTGPDHADRPLPGGRVDTYRHPPLVLLLDLREEALPELSTLP